MAEFRSLSEAEFNAWHAKFKADNGYPLQGRNAATGELVDVGWTTEYTSPIKVDDTDVRFPVDEKVAVKPGRNAPPPKYKADLTLDATASKAELEATPIKSAEAEEVIKP